MSKSTIRSLRFVLRQNWTINHRSIDTSFCDSSKVNGLVLGLYENEKFDAESHLTLAGNEINTRLNGKLETLIKRTGLNGHLGNSRVFNNIDTEFRSIAVVGLGKIGSGFNALEGVESNRENARIAAAIGVRELDNELCSVIQVDAMDHPEAVAEGSGLAIWKCQDNKMVERQRAIPKLELFGSQDSDQWLRGLFKADSQNLARRFSPCVVNVEVRNKDWI